MVNQISIHLVGIDVRAEAGIKIALRKVANDTIIIAEANDITLIDGDSIEGKDYIKKYLRRSDIIMTLIPENYTHEFVIQKPIRVGNLIEQIRDVAKQFNLPNNQANRKNEESKKENQTNALFKKVVEKQQDSIEISAYTANPFQKYHTQSYLDGLAKKYDTTKKNDRLQLDIRTLESSIEKDLEALMVNISSKSSGEKVQQQSNQVEPKLPEIIPEIPIPEKLIPGKSISEKPTQEKLVIEDDRAEKNLIQEVKESLEVAPKKSPEILSNIVLDKRIFDGIKLYEFENRRAAESKNLCGQNQDVNLRLNPSQIFFDANAYLCGKILEAKQWITNEHRLILVRLGNDFILLDSAEERIYTSLPETSLYAISLMPYRQEITIEAVENLDIVRTLIRRIPITYCSSIENFLALITLWSSRGRLPKDTDLNKSLEVKQKQFAIFNKIRIPEVNRILEFWTEKPSSLLEVVDRLLLPQRYIFSFYCVAYVLGFFVTDDDNKEPEIEQKILLKKDESSLDLLLEELQKI